MKYILIVLFCIVCIAFIQCLKNQTNTIGRLIILSVVNYFMQYVVVSGILFWINIFSIRRAVFLLFIFTVVRVFISVKRIGMERIKDIKIQCDIKSGLLSFCAIFIMILFNIGHFEFFGMGQDQGVYQTEAINLYYDIPNKGVIIDEYDELQDGEYKSYYKDFVHGMAGYDILKGSLFVPGVDENKIKSDVEGHWHGIPTYPSILALSAKMFGISDMLVIGTVFFMCFLFLIEFIMFEHGVPQIVRILSIILLGLSPEIIWVKKSSLTEGFLAVLIVMYLYYMLTESENSHIKSTYPIVTFSYFHVSAFTLMPIFVINYWLMYLRTNNKEYITCTKIIILGYLSGFFMMWAVQPRYTLLNYQKPLSFLSISIIIWLVVAACIIGWLLTVLLANFGNKIQACDNHIKLTFKYLCLVSSAFIIFLAVSRHYSTHNILMMTIICYSILSGVVLVPSIFAKLCQNKYGLSNSLMIVLDMFIWCIVIYSIVMRRQVQYYYYYGRYLMPFISIIVILFAFLIHKNYYRIVCLFIGCAALLPYANILRINKDDSRMEWNHVVEVMECSKEATAIILDPNLGGILYYPIKAATNAKVYPVMNTVEETFDYIPEKYRTSCFYISRNMLYDKNDKYTLVYRNKIRYEEDNLDNVSNWSGLVTDITGEGEYRVSIYRVEKETVYINSTETEPFIYGWGNVDNLGFRWVNNDIAAIKCFFVKNDYKMIIEKGCSIPFEMISNKEIDVKVYINEQYVANIEYSKENVDDDYSVVIPKELVKDGYNEIVFECDLWSPSEYGSADLSNYGFSIRGIRFDK